MRDHSSGTGKVVMQARMLIQTQRLDASETTDIVNFELKDLLWQLRNDFRNHHEATAGYAIFELRRQRLVGGEDNRIEVPNA